MKASLSISTIAPVDESHASLSAQAQTITAITIGLPFLGVLAAIRLTWRHGVGVPELVACAIMYVVTFLGVEVGFHRHFAHRSFRAARPVRFILAACGSMGFQGSALWWAGVHRVHHAHADRPGDPHSPLEGLIHAHFGWLFKHLDPPDWRRRARNLYRDDVVRISTRMHYFWAFMGLIIPAVGVALVERSWRGFLLGFLWGGLVRVFLANHVIWSINSICHTYGSRPYSTRDESRNNVLLSLPSLGFSWHNNHHAYPGSAMNSHHWWQLDPCGLFILGLQSVGLAWNVQSAGHPEKVSEGDGTDARSPLRPSGMPEENLRPARPDGVRVLIITPDGTAVAQTRELGVEMLALPRVELMKTPVSPTGKLPATHWICKNYFSDEIAGKMGSYPTRHGTEIIVGGELTTAQVLASRGLKRIKGEQPRDRSTL